MTALRRWLTAIGLGALYATAAASPPAVPAALEPWREWALHGSETLRCPALLWSDPSDENAHVCAWPGSLQVDAGADAARFAQAWTVYAPTLVPLPGDARLRPEAVIVDGRPAAVVLRDGMPMLALEPGRVQVTGTLRWARRPEHLPLPAATAVVVLNLDGKPVAVPELADGRLWLGRSTATVGADALTVRVFRRAQDDVPVRLTTELQLEVSGRAREQTLGTALPPGFVPTALDSPLPGVLAPDGTLRVQLRPGSWRLHLHARAAGAAPALVVPANAEPWPAQEIWSWQADPSLRVTQPVGDTPVDPQQVGAPWTDLPAFALDAGDALTIEERSRGMPDDRAHRLTLQREQWLDFDGAGSTARDRISGRLSRPDRLDMRPPWQLQRASANGEDLLVTRSTDGEGQGVELRALTLDLQATARVAGRVTGPAAGWQQDFDSANIRLHLPPGWRLLHAAGADHAPDAWVGLWSLLDLFVLAIAALLAYRLLGIGFAALVLAYLLLGYQEQDSPLWTLLGVLLFGLFLTVLPEGRLAKVTAFARRASWVLALLVALPFAAVQLKLALYPQLEREQVVGSDDYALGRGYAESVAVQTTLSEPNAPPPPPMPAPQAMQEEGVALDRIEVTGSRMKRANVQQQQQLNQYPTDAIVQAGPGTPDWGWRSVSIGWSGPVVAAQTLDLWLSPPWLSRLWRIAVVALLALLLWRLSPPPARRARAVPLAAAGLAFALLAPAAHAQEFPSQDLLDALRERLLEAPPCAPHCAGLAAVEARIAGNRLQVALELHAAAQTAVPLPDAGRGTALAGARLDGEPAATLRHNGSDWLVVERGVHRAELEWTLAGGERIDVRFPLAPAAIAVDAAGWEAGGMDGPRLQGDTLQLIRLPDTARESGDELPPAQEFPPFVRVTRSVSMELDWTLTTRVERIAPAQAGFTVKVPLLPGERVLDDNREVEDGALTLAFAAGQASTEWRSQLPVAEQLQLTMRDLAQRTERWEIHVGSYWHVDIAGVPELNVDDGSGVRRFQPLPDETLTLSVSRPSAVEGGSLALDGARLTLGVGQRARDATLALDLRSTRGGQYAIGIPAAAELVSATVNDEALHLRNENGRVSVPVVPGAQTVVLNWRTDEAIGLRVQSPAVDLGAPTANLRVDLRLPDDRWLLATAGGGIGPAVLYWPQLLLMLLIAVALARAGGTPLGIGAWLLLGLGFSTVAWVPALFVAGWLLLLAWRERRAVGIAGHRAFALVQVAIALATIVALFCLLVAIPYGLLGQPDMHVSGNGSSAGYLQWFFDRSAGAIPTVSAISLPLWTYKLAILLWALWLANALIGWLRWGWRSFSTGGYWPPKKPKVVQVEQAAQEPQGSNPTQPAEGGS